MHFNYQHEEGDCGDDGYDDYEYDDDDDNFWLLWGYVGVSFGVMLVGGWLLSNQSGHHFVPSHYHPGHLGHLGQNDNDDDHIHNCHHDGGHHDLAFMS